MLNKSTYVRTHAAAVICKLLLGWQCGYIHNVLYHTGYMHVIQLCLIYVVSAVFDTVLRLM